jgi:hypothetical protein
MELIKLSSKSPTGINISSSLELFSDFHSYHPPQISAFTKLATNCIEQESLQAPFIMTSTTPRAVYHYLDIGRLGRGEVVK